MSLRVTFWGVRGTFPATGERYVRYGGDTMCVELECGATRIVLDAGTGLRALGAKLNAARGPISTHILLSHLHLDHIMGLPHFLPFWRDDARTMLWAAQDHIDGDCDRTLFSILKPPLFPLDASALPGAIGLTEFGIGDAFAPEPDVHVRTFPLSHHGAAAGLCVEYGARKVCYVTDHEHGDTRIDEKIAEEIEGADLLIYDATFTDAEMPAHRGWGHSTWEEGLRFKRKAGVKLVAFAHHDPDRGDDALDAMGQAAAARANNVVFARQGMSLKL